MNKNYPGSELSGSTHNVGGEPMPDDEPISLAPLSLQSVTIIELLLSTARGHEAARTILCSE